MCNLHAFNPWQDISFPCIVYTPLKLIFDSWYCSYTFILMHLRETGILQQEILTAIYAWQSETVVLILNIKMLVTTWQASPGRALTHSILEYQASNLGVNRILVLKLAWLCSGICLNNQHFMKIAPTFSWSTVPNSICRHFVGRQNVT